MCMCNMQCAGWTLIILFLPTHADMQQQKKKAICYTLSKHMVMVDTKEGEGGCSAQATVRHLCCVVTVSQGAWCVFGYMRDRDSVLLLHVNEWE